MSHDQEHALDSADHTGTINDTQHGSRGGGSLHAVATSGATNGFMAAADKAKLDGLSASFGSYRAYNSVDAETNHNGNVAFQQKVRLAAAVPANGTYRIEWYLEMRNNSISNSIEAQAQVDDTTTLFLVAIEVKDITNYVPVSGFIELTLTAGTRNIDLDYRLTIAGDTMATRRGRLSIFRVA